jgi:hypothetical protein
LNHALKTVYEYEQKTVLDAIQRQDHVSTFSAHYEGLKIITMFERKYYDQLKAFLRQKNKALLAILLARNNDSLAEAEATLTKTVEDA